MGPRPGEPDHLREASRGGRGAVGGDPDRESGRVGLDHLSPADQAAEFRALWDEFEAVSTAESRYANALDRLQPLLLNSRTGGGSWANHRVTRAQVFTRMEPIRHGAPALWPVVEAIVEDASARGWLLV